ncbi:MAG: DUF58 domain-containing protein [Desulfurococcales archaeon]|nr:DUF58 domain-containing protein [Desulfurococcales archaeon]
MPEIYPTRRALLAGILAFLFFAMQALGIYSPYTGIGASLLTGVLAISMAVAERASRAVFRVNVERRVPPRLAEGVPARVDLVVCNDSPEDLIVSVEDQVPERLRALEREVDMRLQPGECRRGSYRVEPAPGYHSYPSLLVEARDPLGMFASWRKLKRPSSISVYPLGIAEYWVSHAGPQGRGEPLYSTWKGGGLEFYQLRDYVPGDDVRFIAWSATARLGRPIVREGVSQVSPHASLLVDLSLESWPGTPGEAPADWIMRTAVTIAEIIEAGGGTLRYGILLGETWEEGLLSGEYIAETLRHRLSLAGPSNVKRRVKLGALVDRLSHGEPGRPLILLLGPGQSYNSLVKALSGASTNCKIALLYTPTGSGSVDTAVRLVEERYYKANIASLRRVGARFYLVTTRGAAIEVARRLWEVLREPGCGAGYF